jgi:hypothetical protein
MIFTEEWNTTYKENPKDSDERSGGAVVIQNTTKSTRERLDSEHNMGLTAGENQGYHMFAATRITASSTLTVEQTFIEVYSSTADINLTLPALTNVYATGKVKIYYLAHYSLANTRIVSIIPSTPDTFIDGTSSWKVGGRDSVCMILSSYSNKWTVIQQMPSGAIMIWNAGLSSIPAGWVEYTALKKNFPVAYKATGTFNTIGKTGGVKKVNLSISHLPVHSHVIKKVAATSDGTGTTGKYQDGTTNTETKGDDNDHENRPPYAAHIFIQKV